MRSSVRESDAIIRPQEHQRENCTETQAGGDDLRSRDVQKSGGTGDRESALQRQDPQAGALT